MSAQFVRQLGSQPGVQLNPVQDTSDGFLPDNSDQVFAIAMRSKRGRVDQPFLVNSGNFTRKLGTGESIRSNALNEAKVQVFEAVNNGALQAVVSRLTDGTQVNKYIVATADVDTGVITWSLSTTLPVVPFLLAIHHLECFNDGVGVEIHADAVGGGSPVAATVINVNVYDPVDGTSLFNFTGSLDPNAVDDYNQSYFLTDIAAASATTPDIAIIVGTGQTILPTSDAYGVDGSTGLNKVSDSGIKSYFTEGGHSYVGADYVRARQQLEATEFDFDYIASGGNQDPLLIAQLVQLGFDMNRQPRIDVPGTMTPSAAIAWVASLGIDSYYCAFFWAPLQCTDPLNGGKVVLGTAAFNIAKACLRNSARDAKGFAKKQQPIAGKGYPLTRTGLKQLQTPSQPDLSALAQAKINPVILQRYSSGSLYVFTDSLTAAQTNTSYRKLISVADMSSSLDDQVVLFGKEALQAPMDVAIDKVSKFLKKLFEGALAAKWLRLSEFMNNTAFQYNVVPNAQSPADKMDITYSLAYTGVARQITVTQTISR
jgi:hypothetical protein